MNFFAYSILAFFNLFSKQEPAYKIFSNEIIAQHRKEVLEPRHIIVESLGGSSNKGIKNIDIGVATKGPGSISEGRRFLLFLVSDLLNRYNEDIRIRPYLENYPFTEKNLSYTISYNDARGLLFVIQDINKKNQQLTLISMYNGIIFYKIKLSKELGTFEKIHIETYEEAKKILEEEDRHSQ